MDGAYTAYRNIQIHIAKNADKGFENRLKQRRGDDIYTNATKQQSFIDAYNTEQGTSYTMNDFVSVIGDMKKTYRQGQIKINLLMHMKDAMLYEYLNHVDRSTLGPEAKLYAKMK